jgi:hypothetical protein
MADRIVQGSTLFLNGEVIWVNPEGLGHAFIKLRKQVLEERIGDRMVLHGALRRMLPCLDKHLFISDGDHLLPYEGTYAETPHEIEKSQLRRGHPV